MKRTTIALLAACSSAIAFAQQSPPGNVTIYGLADAAMRHASNVAPNRASLKSMDDGIFTGSRLGFRAREDLGGGLSAVLTMESGFEVGSGTSLQATPAADYGQELAPVRFWGREIHVGLRGPWGSVLAGRQYTVAHSLAARFQPQGNPNSTAHSLFSSHHVARQDNVLRLDTKAAGIDFTAAHTFGEQTGSANGSWALGMAYTAGAVSLGAYAQQMENRAGTERRKILGAGGNVKLSPTLTLFGGLMQRSSAVSPQENKAFTLGANIELTKDVQLSLAHYNDHQTGSAALNGSRKLSWVTANYRFSRRSDVYAVLDSNQVDGGYAKPAFMGTKGSQTGLVLGMRHRF